MTSIVSNPEEKEGEAEVWSYQRFRYELFLCLTNVRDTNRSKTVTDDDKEGFLTERKYYEQARKLMSWIPISKPSELIPPFIINFSDLTPKLRSEFEDFCKLNELGEIGIFLKEIAFRFFENIDYSYAHDSVLSHLKLVLEK